MPLHEKIDKLTESIFLLKTKMSEWLSFRNKKTNTKKESNQMMKIYKCSLKKNHFTPDKLHF